MQTNETPAGTGAREGGAGEMPPLSPQPPEKSTKITWEHLRRIEHRTLPLMLLGEDDPDRPESPPQALTRAILNELFRELQALRELLRGCR